MKRNWYPIAFVMSVITLFALTITCVAAKTSVYDNSDSKVAITASLPLEEKECSKVIIIPSHGFIQITCSITAPDSIQLNAQGSGYINNPFTIIYTVTNTGKKDVDNIKAEIILPSGFMMIDPAVKNVSPLLKPGQSAQVSWQVRALSASASGDVTFSIRAFTPDGVEALCDKIIFLPALKISLLCISTVPDTLRFDPITKTYQPDPFTATLTLNNKSLSQMDSVTATIILPPELELDAGEQATKSLGTMYGGHVRSLSWQVRVKGLLPAGKDVQILFNYSSLTLPSAECLNLIHINSAGEAKLSCTLTAPDTLHYHSAGYEPNPFTILLQTTNNGYQDAINVHAYMLQDQRFNIVGRSDTALGTLAVGASASASFMLRVQPRYTSGYDTIRTLLTVDGIAPTICEHIIWVERKSIPSFAFLCTATLDSLRFDPKLRDYVPNPFIITLEAQNSGDADAFNCQFVFIGPPRFTLASGTPIHPLGTMLIGDRRTDQFQMRALPQQKAIVDTIIFQVQSQSSTGEIIISECRVPIFVPPAFGPQYTLTCSMPDSLRAVSGGYSPNPFTVTAVVTNAGSGNGSGIQSTIVLPTGFTLATGEQPSKNLPDITAGGSTQVSWNVVALDQQKPTSSQICVSVKDKFGVEGACCRQIFVPAASKQNLLLRCTTKDTLHATQTGYIENPFTVQATIVNNASYSINGITATLTADPAITLLDPAMQTVAGPLAPSQSVLLSWRVTALAQRNARDLPFTINVTAPGEQPASCTVSTFATVVPPQVLLMTCTASIKDTLHFLFNQGVFEQDPFTLTTRITNPGPMDIPNLRVNLALPPGIALAQGEQPDKVIPMFNAGSSTDVQWKIKPIRKDAGVLQQFKIQTVSQIVLGQNIESIECNVSIYIQGAPRVAIFSLPNNLLGQFGERIPVPMTIECPGGTDMYDYSIRLRFDGKVIRFVDAIALGQLNTLGWVGPNVKILNQDEIEINGRALNQSASYKENTLFLTLTFEAIFGSGREQLEFAQSAISFQFATVNQGNVYAQFNDGSITVSGICVEPLRASAAYNLFQNNPNPFNPQTVIVFTLPEETIARLEVYDGMGQPRGILINKVLTTGKYSVLFDGASYPSGTYYYRLITPKYKAMKRMVLVK